MLRLFWALCWRTLSSGVGGDWSRHGGSSWAQVQEQRWRKGRQAMLLRKRQGRTILRRGFAMQTFYFNLFESSLFLDWSSWAVIEDDLCGYCLFGNEEMYAIQTLCDQLFLDVYLHLL